MESRYNTLVSTLKSMKEEYKIMPSKFLLKQIELCDKKIKQIDSALGRTYTGGGNYTGNLKHE